MSLEAPMAEVPQSDNEEEQSAEKVVAAAVRFGGQVFTGVMHFHAREKAKEEFPDFPHRDGEVQEEGFLTSTGRFVDRDEATDIADKADQLKEGSEDDTPLQSQNVNFDA